MYIPNNLCGISLRPSMLHMESWMDKMFHIVHAYQCQLKKLAKFVRINMSHFSKEPRVDGNTVNDNSQVCC